MNVSRKCFPIENNAEIKKIRTDSTALYADKTYERLENYAKKSN